jgi:hyperosmotically inducible periplasmic protein
MKTSLPLLALALALIMHSGGCNKRTDQTRPAPDNTASNAPANKPDTTKSPMDQSQTSEDIRITADIRRAVLNDKAMSMNAQNCKIITDNMGKVVLRGIVDTQREKDTIEALAKATAGVKSVENQLEVKLK